jgi:hypothetical protein
LNIAKEPISFKTTFLNDFDENGDEYILKIDEDDIDSERVDSQDVNEDHDDNDNIEYGQIENHVFLKFNNEKSRMINNQNEINDSNSYEIIVLEKFK